LTHTTSLDVSGLKIGRLVWALVAWTRLGKAEIKEKLKNRKSATSSYWGGETIFAVAMSFGFCLNLLTIINFA
jgi:hypothetical protein